MRLLKQSQLLLQEPLCYQLVALCRYIEKRLPLCVGNVEAAARRNVLLELVDVFLHDGFEKVLDFGSAHSPGSCSGLHGCDRLRVMVVGSGCRDAHLDLVGLAPAMSTIICAATIAIRRGCKGWPRAYSQQESIQNGMHMKQGLTVGTPPS